VSEARRQLDLEIEKVQLEGKKQTVEMKKLEALIAAGKKEAAADTSEAADAAAPSSTMISVSDTSNTIVSPKPRPTASDDALINSNSREEADYYHLRSNLRNLLGLEQKMKALRQQKLFDFADCAAYRSF